ncbi:MAG: bifunctional UDP-N-acetylmuramoyl-tripeptide:D-alanyl-D-alanine ligase/alanine racemase [Flammeovirgaceae bacterium]|nr:bifunctional UDP-N-acetylmuramoyl-tripeptide:D-alanyl-D-alanine ligase/alanine racemase [Flammeovirgaceae bacterium]
MVTLSELQHVTQGRWLTKPNENLHIRYIFSDSRKTYGVAHGAFFAMRGTKHNAHAHVDEVYAKGIRIFIVEEEIYVKANDAAILLVPNTLFALQQLAAYHRKKFTLPVVGITGSNGKTIVKEWLYQVLADRFSIVKNPGSYNSQLGVPLSVWQIQAHHTLGIFEAGISLPGEMQKLEKIIQPTLGIFTNLGSAHDEGFTSREEKLKEKLKLFEHCDTLVYCNDAPFNKTEIDKLTCKKFTWGNETNNDVVIQKDKNGLSVTYDKQTTFIELPFADAASIENTGHVIATLLFFQTPLSSLQQYIQQLRTVPMRLQVKAGINNSIIIDDSYNNDLAGLAMSLDFLNHQNQRKTKHLILSSLLQASREKIHWIQEAIRTIQSFKIDFVTLIGKEWQEEINSLPPQWKIVTSTESFLQELKEEDYANRVLLIKGARSFQFEKIVKHFEQKIHGTVLEIDLNALVDNYNYFKSLLNPGTKMMVMVKAFAYGSGSVEIANILQYHRVDYLGVAYADEGVQLRKNNIQLPIMVLNPAAESFQTMLDYALEPEMYSFKILSDYLQFLNGKKGNIHIKIDTGMHRLGFAPKEIDLLSEVLKAHPHIKVISVFSHLAGSDESKHDAFSHQQAKTFLDAANQLTKQLGYKPLYHLLNSPGLLRFPGYQFDMIRLGIGLYGIDPTENKNPNIQPVATLKTVVSQIHHLQIGETVGYGRHGKIEKETVTATLAIGYADGYSRAFSKGIGEVLINGKMAKVIGNVCMDMMMVDVTGLHVKEGDEVEIYGKHYPIEAVAKKINTIPYEILTNTSERVKRIFISAGI